jgi:hyperosmotically inducible periplasmic protein
MKREGNMKRLMLMGMVLVFVVAMIGCQTLTGRSAGETVDDATITSEINIKIINDHDLKFLKIGVETFTGHVTLTGAVPSKEAEDRLVALAKAIKGVKDVKSNLIIKQ